MKFISTATLAATALLLSACEKSNENEVAAVERFFARNPVGSSADYLLIKQGMAGRDPVGVIFGFLDDGDFCKEIADLYMKKYPEVHYRCEQIPS